MTMHLLTPTHARQLYNNTLNSALLIPAFYARVADILESNPYFMPAYLDMLWRAEERSDTYLYEQILAHAHKKIIDSLFLNRALQAELSEHWTVMELAALEEILRRVAGDKTFSFGKRLRARAQMFFARKQLIEIKTRMSPQEPRHLRLVKHIDIAPVKKEVGTMAPFWWQIETRRQETITHHQDTWGIILRARRYESSAFKAADGEHESIPAKSAAYLPNTHEAVLSLAKELRIGLGRVAIVMLKPFSQSYRHYDAEPYLAGRNRYHLVVACGEKNILSSGSETAAVREGDLWFFDNKVMHRAHNQSPVPRVHIIFDGYPLD